MIFIIGGSLGSHALNIAIEKLLTQLTNHFNVVHQIGNLKEFDDFDRLSKIKTDKYLAREHFSAEEVSWLMHNSELIICRSGANTIFEIVATRIPAILVPLPWSAGREQEQHAQLLKEKGVAEVWHQDDQITELYELILKVYKHRLEYERRFDSLASYIQPDAVKKILKQILSER